MSDRLQAHHENRIYYFTVERHQAAELKITMYGMVYTLVKKGAHWVNHPSNQMEMKTGLIAAVILAAGEIEA